jgi:hypothetical protein
MYNAVRQTAHKWNNADISYVISDGRGAAAFNFEIIM